MTDPHFKRVACAGLAACFMVATTAAGAADSTVKQVQFKTGASAANVAGTLKGRQDVDYQVRASAGQTLTVKSTAPKASAAFTIRLWSV